MGEVRRALWWYCLLCETSQSPIEIESLRQVEAGHGATSPFSQVTTLDYLSQ